MKLDVHSQVFHNWFNMRDSQVMSHSQVTINMSAHVHSIQVVSVHTEERVTHGDAKKELLSNFVMWNKAWPKVTIVKDLAMIHDHCLVFKPHVFKPSQNAMEEIASMSDFEVASGPSESSTQALPNTSPPAKKRRVG